ncbi:MAG TPA: ComEC family competence protein [bacterium]|nr:ComEC family competence protein [bacterium]
MTSSKIFIYLCICFISGIFISSFVLFSQQILLSFLIVAILLISVLWKYKRLTMIGFCLIFLILGIWRYQIVDSRIRNSELIKFTDLSQKITLIGIVNKEPDVRKDSTKLTIKIRDFNILATVDKYLEYKYGDKIEITGKFNTPQVFDEFNYKDYLAKQGIIAVVYKPEIRLIKKNQGNLILSNVLLFKESLRNVIYKNLSPPQSSILGAMILGDKRKISEDLNQKLNITGLRHITAVSGLHITVLTTILMSLLIGLGLWRKHAFYLSIIIIALFIIMIGLQPSAIRAGIMGGLFLLGQYLGRMSISSRAVVFASALMLFQNPLLLKLDIGFQLSFLAILGIICFLYFFEEQLKFIPESNTRSILAMTFSAYLFTLPVLIYNFGLVSLVSPFTNILVVPILYWIMLFGFVFTISGIFWPFLGWILSWFIWFILTYIIKVVDFFSSFSWASVTLEISLIWLVIFYLILGYFTFLINQRQKLKFLNY